MSAPRLPRPRPRERVLIDPNNAYTRLGVSPLVSTEQIKAEILRKQNEVKARRGARADQRFGQEEEELTELQRIEDEIGSPRAREAYDREYPQNELLTVQPSPRDRALDRKARATLVSAWLVEELGRGAPLPSPECLHLWIPAPVDPELLRALAPFADGKPGEAPGTTNQALMQAPEQGGEAPLDPSMLSRFPRGQEQDTGEPQSAAPVKE